MLDATATMRKLFQTNLGIWVGRSGISLEAPQLFAMKVSGKQIIGDFVKYVKAHCQRTHTVHAQKT